MTITSSGRRVPVTIAAFLCALLLAACGGSGSQPGQDDNPLLEMQRGMEVLTALYNDVADTMASIENEDSANAAAARLRDDHVPQAEATGSSMVAAMTSISQHSDEQIDAWEADFDDARFLSVEEQHDAAVNRMSDEFERITLNPQLITTDLQGALQAFGETMLAMEHGMEEAMLGLP